ncbi:hypothetical protein WJX84_009236 [Apatococcus fuscideae]|uniref:U-box domain-containing protein n=1 Tax=Apatococcus fuscideae TaxID=2026836 RepID=A0AAW1T302_9CHLO
MTSPEGDYLLEACDLAYQLQHALRQPPASGLSNSRQSADTLSNVQSLLERYKALEDGSSNSSIWGEHGGAVLEQLVDALQAGVMKTEQAAAFCRVRAYLSIYSLAAALSSAQGNLETCLKGLMRLPSLPQGLKEQTLAVSNQLGSTTLALASDQSLRLAELRKTNDLLWNGLVSESDCHCRLDTLICDAFPDGFDIPELRASISDLARGAGEENQQKEHREGHLLMQVSRVLQRRLQLATSSSTHSFLSTASHSLTSTVSSSLPATPPKEFVCPISGDLMADPVLLVETGMTFDRASIQEWLGRGNQTCPLTHQRLTSGQMVPNFSLKGLIEGWARENQVALPQASAASSLPEHKSRLPAGLGSGPSDAAARLPKPRLPEAAAPPQPRAQNQPMASFFASNDTPADAPGTPPRTANPFGGPPSPHHPQQEDDARPASAFMHARTQRPLRQGVPSPFGAATIPEGDSQAMPRENPSLQARNVPPVSAFADCHASGDPSAMDPPSVPPGSEQRPSHQPTGPPSFRSRPTGLAPPHGADPQQAPPCRESPFSSSMPAAMPASAVPPFRDSPGTSVHPRARQNSHGGSGMLLDRQDSNANYTVPASLGRRPASTSLAAVSQDQVLWESALAGSSRDVLLAIRRGAGLEWHSTCGKTPLLCAAAAGHPAVVQILLEQGVNVAARDVMEESVVHHAAGQGRLNVLRILLSSNHPSIPELLCSQNSVGDTPIHCAASIGSAPCTIDLLDACSPGATDIQNHLGRTPLHVAAQQGHSRVVTTLLQAGAKHTATDDGGLTPLHTACCSGDIATVSALVKAGAKRDAWDILDRQPIDVIGCHRCGEDNQEAQDAIVQLLRSPSNSVESQKMLDAMMEQRRSYTSGTSDTTQERMEGEAPGQSSHSLPTSNGLERKASDTCSADSGSRTRSGAGDVQLPPLPRIGKQRLERALRPLVEPGATQTHLDLSWQGLDKEDTKAVAIMLLHNRSLTSLEFHGNKPTRRGIKHLCQALEHNRVLTSLTLGDSDIDHESACLIAQTLSSCWLTHLNLWNARLGNESARPILRALHANTRLLSLDLGSNELGPEVGTMVAGLLRNNGALETLDLRTNRLGKAGINALAEACTQNSSLRELLLNNNGMPIFGLNNAKAIFKARKAAVNLRVKWS